MSADDRIVEGTGMTTLSTEHETRLAELRSDVQWHRKEFHALAVIAAAVLAGAPPGLVGTLMIAAVVAGGSVVRFQLRSARRSLHVLQSMITDCPGKPSDADLDTAVAVERWRLIIGAPTALLSFFVLAVAAPLALSPYVFMPGICIAGYLMGRYIEARGERREYRTDLNTVERKDDKETW